MPHTIHSTLAALYPHIKDDSDTFVFFDPRDEEFTVYSHGELFSDQVAEHLPAISAHGTEAYNLNVNVSFASIVTALGYTLSY